MADTLRRTSPSSRIKITRHRGRNKKETDDKKPISIRVQSSTVPVKNVVTKDVVVNREPWQRMSLIGALPPLATTVTSVNQSHDLQGVKGVEIAESGACQTSSAWLEKHSVESESITLGDLMKEGILIRPASDSPDQRVHLKFELTKINQFHFKLARVIEMCQKRVDWLMSRSRKIFGLLKGQRVGVLVDTSDVNCSYGRLQMLQHSLQMLVNEQLVNKDKLHLVSFGTNSVPLWEGMREINCRMVNEVRNWVNQLQPSGGCNLMGALRQLIKWNTFDSIVIILGSEPDQDADVVYKYVQEALVGRELPLHTIAFDCIVPVNNKLLQDLAKLTGGRYHCFSLSSEEKILTSTDLQQLVKEIQKAREILLKIQDMKNGQLDDKVIIISGNESKRSLDLVPVSENLEVQQVTEKVGSLSVEHPTFPARTSSDWLKQHGLKAKGLNLYQVLAPNTYSYTNGYVSTINKNVRSRIYQENMAQFPWHDGTVKNVHVDPTMLYSYQMKDFEKRGNRIRRKLTRCLTISRAKEQLEAVVQHYMRRLDWLSSGCRKVFGTMVEQSVIIIIDMSVSTGPCLSRLKQDLKLLFEQQLANKKLFNVICYGGSLEMFRSAMVEPSKDYLQACWRWFLKQKCNGSRNFLEAFRAAVENSEDIAKKFELESIYIISSGMPDNPKDLICSFVKESLAGRDATLNCIYYEDDNDGSSYLPGRYATVPEIASCLQEIAHAGRGRFHWFRTGTGVIESDDIRIIHGELNKAYKYSQNTGLLLDSVKRKRISEENHDDLPEETELIAYQKPKTPIPPPKQTILSQARLTASRTRPLSAKETTSKSYKREKAKPRPQTAVEDVTVKALCWKPNTKTTTGNLIPELPRSQLKTDRDKTEFPKQVFYTEVGNSVGTIFRDASPGSDEKKSIRKILKDIEIPEKEENISTRDWMKRFSISKLKLDLNHMIGGTECSHSKSKVASLRKTVPARYCEIFPTVKIKGVIKHLHLTSHELEQYENELEKVMKRYVKRLQWLMSGSRRVFGTITEKKVVVLIDTSGSMVTSMAELQAELTGLIWEQFKLKNIAFNLIRFSDEPMLWQPSLVTPSEENCENAAKWVKTFQAHGSTCTLEALKAAFSDREVQGIYLLTDGKPINSTTMVLRELAKLNNTRNIQVHTISFNCDDSTANKFLQILAAQTSGRYHRSQPENAAHFLAHKLLTEKVREDEPLALPVFEGDDLRKLVSEISTCRKFLLQARSYRSLIQEFSQDKHKSKHITQQGSTNLTRFSARNRRSEDILANSCQ